MLNQTKVWQIGMTSATEQTGSTGREREMNGDDWIEGRLRVCGKNDTTDDDVGETDDDGEE